MAVRRWSTDPVPVSQRFEFFEDFVATALTPLRVSSDSTGEFFGNVELVDLGGLTILRMRGARSTAVRGTREIERSGERTFHLLANLAAPWTLVHRGSLRLGIGDAVLTDSNLHHWLDYACRYDVINLKLSERWIRQWLPDPAAIVGKRLSAESPWGRALTSYMSQLMPEFVATAPLPPRLIADHIGALLALMANEITTNRRQPSTGEKDLVNRSRDLILQRCAEGDLTAQSLAAELQVSVRTLHRLLAGAQLTFGGLLTTARAERAVAMLESTMHRRLSVAEVGRRSGFQDASHFARVLKGRTGLTPSALRRRAIDPGATQDLVEQP